MSNDNRHKDSNWVIHTNADGTVPSADARLAVLMDIRDEMKNIRGYIRDMSMLLHCPNFLAIPRKLDSIRRNTTRKRKRK